MLVEIDLADALAAASLLSLQRAAYRQEARLIGYPHLPPLLEGLPQLMDCGETVMGWRREGELLGALGFLAKPEQFELCRLMVAPYAQRQGIARRLIEALLARAGQRQIVVSTAAANIPALALYQQCGFVPSQQHYTPDGLCLQQLTHTAAARQ